jgi:signal transduction histidine kinase
VLATASLEPPAVLERLCALVVPALGEACGLRLLSEDGQWLNPVGAAHSDPALREAFQVLISGPQRVDEGLAAIVVRKGESLLLSALPPEVLRRAVAPSMKEAAERFPFSDLLILPLRVRGRVVGTLAIARGAHSRTFDDAERMLLQEVADRAAVVLDVARAYEAEQRARKAAELAAERILRMQRATQALSEALTPQDVAGVAIREAMEVVRADQSIVAVPAEDPAWMEILSSRNLPQSLLEDMVRFPVEAPMPPSEVHRTGMEQWLETPDEMVARFPAVMQRPDVLTQALACLPLITRGHTLGSLVLSFLEPRTFSEPERAFLRDLSGQVAQALERARLYAAEKLMRTRAQRAAERASRLQAVVAELSPAFTAARVAEVVVDHGVSAVGARNGGLWLLEPEGTHARLVRSIGHSHDVVERFHRLPLNLDAPLMRALREGRPVWIEDPETAVLRSSTAESRGEGAFSPTPSLACLPLRAEGRTVGALVLGFTEPRRFDADERTFLELLVHPAAEALARARLLEQLQQAVRLREEFLSIASHELKTPISALQLQIHNLLTLTRTPAGPTPERLRRGLEAVDRQVRRQTQLINDLLDVSRIQAGRLELHPEPLELSTLVREVAERFEPELARSGSHLRLQLSEEARGQWDRLRLDQVLTNLLSNAMKYGRGQPIALSTEVAEGQVRIHVKDGGIGIAAEALSRLFNRFERAVSDRNYGGFGLGLWITRQIIESMGGRIHVSSELGVGSTFTVELPLTPATAAAAPPAPRP